MGWLRLDQLLGGRRPRRQRRRFERNRRVVHERRLVPRRHLDAHILARRHVPRVHNARAAVDDHDGRGVLFDDDDEEAGAGEGRRVFGVNAAHVGGERRPRAVGPEQRVVAVPVGQRADALAGRADERHGLGQLEAAAQR